MTLKYKLVPKGKEYTENYRLFFCNQDNVPISPFHDIPLFADEKNRIYNMIVEIPRFTNAKMEIATKEPMNPLKQDVKRGQLRFVRNCFPYHGYLWNYGAFPQTLEDGNHVHELTGCKGDNDLIDVIDIGSRVHERGSVIQVKVLGCLALIDLGETDWKIIVVDVNDSEAPNMNDIDDVIRLKPGLLEATRRSFKIYKIPDGDEPNEYALNGEAQNREFSYRIIEETHNCWKKLIVSLNNESGLSLTNVSVENSPYRIANSVEIVNKAPAHSGTKQMSQLEQAIIDKWHFISV